MEAPFLNHKKTVSTSDAIAGKQSMDLREAKLLRLLIMQINMKDSKLMEYKADIKDVADCLGVDDSNLYRDVQKICKSLTSRQLGIKSDDPKQQWKFYPWMSMAEYDGEGTLTLGLNEKIRPFVIELNELFTQYEMIDILTINSFYALRIYELLKKEFTKCRKEKHVFEFTIQELREITDTEDKFKQIGHFRDKVINIAEREINEKTDIYIYIDSIKKSRRFTGFKFTIKENKKRESLTAPTKEENSINIITETVQDKQIPGQIDLANVYKLKELMTASKIPCSQTQAEYLFEAYSYDLERFKRNLDYVISRGGGIDNPIAYLFTIKSDDISPKADLPKPERQQHKKRDLIDPMSESRKQAYIDMESDFAEDLWPDLPFKDEQENQNE